ncbi:MAG: CopG family transcriptional regulator [Persephonella sp.]|nr:MAG: CopG family transcriptional regulator [Persephonella sp.]RUM60902.1 MAG: CopG family transcriptional regulator [Persephonella sp.]
MAHVRLNISLEEELAKELDEVAKELGEKKSHIIRDALMYYFDYLDIKIAEKRLKAIEDGKSKLIPAEEVFKEAGLE